MKKLNKKAALFLVMSTLLGFNSPVSSQQNSNCNVGAISEMLIIHDVVGYLEAGDFAALVEVVDIDGNWPLTKKNELMRGFTELLSGQSVRSCSLLQRYRFSDDFFSEVMLIEFEKRNLHVFAAYLKLDTGWKVIKLQFESEFDRIYQFLR